MGLHRVVGAEHAPQHLRGSAPTDTGAALSAISRPAPGPRRAARRRGGRCARARRRAPRGPGTRGRCSTHSSAWLMPTTRGRNQLEPPRARCHGGRTRSRAWRRRRREPDVHRQRHRDADADRRAVDGGDHRLRALEDAQREQPAAVAGRRRRARPCGRRWRSASNVSPPPPRSAPAQKPRPRAGHDHGPHVVVGVGLVERVDHLAHHRPGEGVELLGPVERDVAAGTLDLVGDLGERRARHP